MIREATSLMKATPSILSHETILARCLLDDSGSNLSHEGHTFHPHSQYITVGNLNK